MRGRTGLFSVNSLLCIGNGEESEVQSIYTDFPRWKEKFNNLVLINSGNFIQQSKNQLLFCSMEMAYVMGLKYLC